MSNATAYAVLRGEKNYGRLLAAGLINSFGDSVDAIAYSLMMYQITGSASMMAVLLGLNYLPSVLLTPFAGVLVDRLPKKRMMVLTDVGRGLLVLGTAVLMYFGALPPLLLAAVTMGNSALEALRDPAGGAIVPMLLPEEKYEVGVALRSSLCRVTDLVGLALAGGIVAAAGIVGALMIDVATFFLSAAIIGTISLREERRAETIGAKQIVVGLWETLSFVRARPVLFSALMLGMVVNVTMVPINTCLTPYVTDVLGRGPEMLSAVQICIVLGMGVGAFLAPKLRGLAGWQKCMLGGLAAAAGLAATALLPWLGESALRDVCVAGAMALLGMGAGVVNVVFNTGLMRLTPAERMGAVSGLTTAACAACTPLASFAFAGVVGAMALTEALLWSAVLCAGIFIAMVFIKPIKEI